MCQVWIQIRSFIQRGTYVGTLGQNKTYALPEVQREVLAEKSDQQRVSDF